MRPALQLVFVVIVLGIVTSALVASTASTSTPDSSVGTHNEPITADGLKPAQCAGITLTAVVSGSVVITGTAANELIVGSNLIDAIDGAGGDDCILGGGAADVIVGGAGNDVCIGGGQLGDTFLTCETEIP